MPINKSTHETGARAKAGLVAAKRTRGPRQLYVVRHGERIDFTFGKDWIRNSFDSAGGTRAEASLGELPESWCYTIGSLLQAIISGTILTCRNRCQRGAEGILITSTTRLSLRKVTFKRACSVKTLLFISHSVCEDEFKPVFDFVGNALKDVEVPIDHVYPSPSLRCLQTATGIVQGLGLQRKLHVEPGLFEWLGWYKTGLPVFMNNEELVSAGFNIDATYEPVWPVSRYNLDEDIDGYYDRCHETTRAILQRHEHEGETETNV